MMKPKDINILSGKYRFICYLTLPTGKTEILIITPWKHNIILNLGSLNVLNLLGEISNTHGIRGMGIGTGTGALNKTNNGLSNETVRVPVTNVTVNSTEFYLSLTASFNAADMNISTELGLFDNPTKGSGIILTRVVYPAGQVTFPVGTTAGVQYIMGLNTGVFQTNWTLTSGKTSTYQATQDTSVLGVIESDTGNGYVKVASITQVEATANTYYYDSNAKLLYVHCSDGADPSTHDVMVISGSS